MPDQPVLDAAPRRRRPPPRAAPVRRRHLAGRSARRRHRPALPDLRPPRAARAARRSSAAWPGSSSRGDPAVTAAVSTDPRRDRRPGRVTAATTVARTEPSDEGGPLAVFRNSGFLRLWLSQAATQIGGNMVLFGLTVIVVNSTELEHRGQPADPDVPRAGRAVLGGRRRLRRPDRPAADPDRDERPARRSRSSALYLAGDEPRAHPAAQHRRSRRSPCSSRRPSWR